MPNPDNIQDLILIINTEVRWKKCGQALRFLEKVGSYEYEGLE